MSAHQWKAILVLIAAVGLSACSVSVSESALSETAPETPPVATPNPTPSPSPSPFQRPTFGSIQTETVTTANGYQIKATVDEIAETQTTSSGYVVRGVVF